MMNVSLRHAKRFASAGRVAGALSVLLLSLLSGCALFEDRDPPATLPTAPGVAPQTAADTATTESQASAGARVSAPAAEVRPASACPVPAGWVLFQMPVNETVFSLARRADIVPDALLHGNCQLNPAAYPAGSWFYVPPAVAAAAPQTALPLGISALTVEPTQVSPGEVITVGWQAEGPVINVRLGWSVDGQFVEIASNLAAAGMGQLPVPDDAQAPLGLVLRASDGLHEVVAEAALQLRCQESWFFAPAPAECPLPPIITALVEQRFERGTVLHIPALNTQYALVDGAAAQEVTVSATMTRPVTADTNLAPPPGLALPTGVIGEVWHRDEPLRTALGYATGPPLRYTGMLQRSSGAHPATTLFFSTPRAQVYRVGLGGAWRTISAR